MTIAIDIYHTHHTKDLSAFDLPEDQLTYTSLPMDKIQREPSALHLVILHDEHPVGYFCLQNNEKKSKYTRNPRARLLTSFSINASMQGKGYAKNGLLLLPAFLRQHTTEIDEVVLGVNKRNFPAIQLYKKTGFVDHGEVVHGPKGAQHVFHLPI